MGVDICPKCGARMLTYSGDGYDDNPLYCIICGTQGGIPYRPNNIQGSQFNKAGGPTRHTARYRAVLQEATTDGEYHNKELQHLTVRYRLTHAERPTSTIPALIMECPWCGGVTKAQTWKSSRKGYVMQVECPSHHNYSMICNADGDYYWR